MKDTLAALLLFPVLMWQGKKVRRDVPKLPEAQGARSGVTGQGPALRLWVLGDSAAAGVGAGDQSDALMGCLLRELAPTFKVDWRLLATTGHAAQDVIRVVEQAPCVAVDVVVTSVGANDVTSSIGCRRWLQRQQQLVRVIEERFAPQRIVLSGIPPMHLFPALPHPLRWYLGHRARRFNRALQAWVRHHPRCAFVSIDVPITPDHMAEDGFHPGPLGYVQWAKGLAPVVAEGVVVGGRDGKG